MDTLLFIPAVCHPNKISSRIGLSQSAVAFREDFNLFNEIAAKKADNPNVTCVLVDEAQFLKKEQVRQLAQVVDQLNLPVLAYGLRTDFQGEPFQGSLYLLAWADNLIEIKTICHCGKKATMNARLDAHGKVIKTGQQIEIGGNEKYISLCRRHFWEA